MPPLPTYKTEWDIDDRELLLKFSNRPRYTDSSRFRICAFVEEAENFEMCDCSSDQLVRLIIFWLSPNKPEIVRRFHFVARGVDYLACRKGLLTCRLDFKNSFKQHLRVSVLFGAESVAEFTLRTIELSTRVYHDFPIDTQLDLVADQFISSLRDALSSHYLRCKFASWRITWQKAVQMAQAGKVLRAAEYTYSSDLISLDTMCAQTPNLAHSATLVARDCAMLTQIVSRYTNNSRRRDFSRKSPDAQKYSR